MKTICSWMRMKKRLHRAKQRGRMRRLKEERVDERLLEKIDISFALTIDVQVILSRQRWRIGNLKSRRQLVVEERKCLVMDLEKNEWYFKPAVGGGSGNSRGKRLAISMVVEAWLSDKEEM
ncbi:hypothetical protein Tco_1110687 [Tanacetum coccineum]|uniref:Uncharacterized protein n=1 Tax=Tanacetum coccineum TaxID=301880 RepID=A0ABQ5IJQ9_9ASTR